MCIGSFVSKTHTTDECHDVTKGSVSLKKQDEEKVFREFLEAPAIHLLPCECIQYITVDFSMSVRDRFSGTLIIGWIGKLVV